MRDPAHCLLRVWENSEMAPPSRGILQTPWEDEGGVEKPWCDREETTRGSSRMTFTDRAMWKQLECRKSKHESSSCRRVVPPGSDSEVGLSPGWRQPSQGKSNSDLLQTSATTVQVSRSLEFVLFRSFWAHYFGFFSQGQKFIGSTWMHWKTVPCFIATVWQTFDVFPWKQPSHGVTRKTARTLASPVKTC